MVRETSWPFSALSSPSSALSSIGPPLGLPLPPHCYPSPQCSLNVISHSSWSKLTMVEDAVPSVGLVAVGFLAFFALKLESLTWFSSSGRVLRENYLYYACQSQLRFDVEVTSKCRRRDAPLPIMTTNYFPTNTTSKLVFYIATRFQVLNTLNSDDPPLRSKRKTFPNEPPNNILISLKTYSE